MAGKDKKVDMVQQYAIQVETIRKEQRHQKLHTEFSLNPRRKLHILPDKPMSKKPEEVTPDNTDFIEALHRANREPTKKYATPQTESQEIGWISTQLNPSSRNDKRFNYFRVSTDVTIYQELALRSSH